MHGKQRYRCEACGLNFTGTPPGGTPLRFKLEAGLLYLSGLSMNRSAKLLGVSTPSVQAWIEARRSLARRAEAEGRAGAVEHDEMWLFLKKVGALGIRKARAGYGSADRLELGGRDAAAFDVRNA